MGFTAYSTAYATAYGGWAPPIAISPGSPASFLAAIRARLLADPAFVGLAVGGLFNRTVPPGRGHPVVLTTLIPGGDEPAGGTSYMQTGLLQMSAYGTDTPTLRVIQDRAAQLLTYPNGATGTPGDLAPQLRWDGGYAMWLWPGAPLPQPAPTPGPGGAWIFGELRQYQYRFAASYAGAAPPVPGTGVPANASYATAYGTGYGTCY